MKNTFVLLALLGCLKIVVGSTENPVRDFQDEDQEEYFNADLEYDYHDAPLKRNPTPKPKRPLVPVPIRVPPPIIGPPVHEIPIPPEPEDLPQDVGYVNNTDIPDEKNLCPEANGFFPHPKQCDRYYECVNFEAYEQLCPDGLVFVVGSPKEEKCELRFAHDCSSRPFLQKAQPTPNCDRRYGFFNHTTDCGIYYHCINGVAALHRCPPGLVFNFKIAICIFPNKQQRINCNLEPESLSIGALDVQEKVPPTIDNSTPRPLGSEETPVTETGSLEMDF